MKLPLAMDSQLYIVIPSQDPLSQIISKHLAEKGNSIVYLTDNESEGYAIAAEEPRVRYRFCSPRDLNAIEHELYWVERNISTINSVVVMVNEEDIDQAIMPISEDIFSRYASRLDENQPNLSLTYVISPKDNEKSSDSLAALHLKLCELAHQDQHRAGIKINHVVLSPAQEALESVCAGIAKDASDLIHFLSTNRAKAMQQHAFYFSN
ncbi:hypothetical protein [Enterovibrio baiacu]|uniref:hypothetical protein n=1 Tax=Enterovibrio baiacu TaxID=2491023 RepID=UPI001386D9C2|nr:hypothetical protein [Enterovibrio baiacu]